MNEVVRKPLEIQSNTVVVSRRDVLGSCRRWCNSSIGQTGTDKNKEANQISKDRRTTDVKMSTRVVGGV